MLGRLHPGLLSVLSIVVVESSFYAAAGLLGMRADGWSLLQMSVSDCRVLLVLWGLHFVGAGFRPPVVFLSGLFALVGLGREMLGQSPCFGLKGGTRDFHLVLAG